MLEPIAKVMEYLSALFLSFAPPETYRIIRGRDEREHGRIDVSAPDMNAIKRESAEGSPMRCEKDVRDFWITGLHGQAHILTAAADHPGVGEGR